ncbi:hypothetical protein GW17_00017579 [Ensete ventricosum]|nr:hypothetical protein GW17_00017579 [Ensete ventricosum]RZR75818.1 hypothetical protein BHM03_00000322 [Ensete ventricosum]
MAQIGQAWHLLTALVRLGRPTPPADLAARCDLTLSPSPDIVEFLCQIPESPLLLTDGGFVTISDSAVAAFLGFLSNAVAPFVPRIATVGSAQMRTCGNVSATYARKRKVRPLDDDLVVDVPIAKRRLLLPCGGGIVFIIIAVAFQDYMEQKPTQLVNDTETLTERGPQMTVPLTSRVKEDLSETNGFGATKYYYETLIGHALKPIDGGEATAALCSQSKETSIEINPLKKSPQEIVPAGKYSSITVASSNQVFY